MCLPPSDMRMRQQDMYQRAMTTFDDIISISGLPMVNQTQESIIFYTELVKLKQTTIISYVSRCNPDLQQTHICTELTDRIFFQAEKIQLKYLFL